MRETPLTKNAHTGAPAEEKGPSALSTERFGKEDAAAQGVILQAQGHEKAPLGGLFLCPGAPQVPTRGKKR